MRLNSISELVFYRSCRHELEDYPFAYGCGPIVTIKLQDTNNWPYTSGEVLRILWHVMALMDGNYSKPIIEDGEVHDCSIRYEMDEREMTVIHKHWSYDKTMLFERILRSMAVVHGWAIRSEA
jgi:hypothetical protein